MRTLVVLLAAVTCTVAEPILVGYNFPRYFDYRYPYTPAVPITPVVRSVLPTVPYYAGLKAQYYDRDLIGQARYGHIEPGQSHHAVQDAFGNKIGGFSYYDAEGKLVQTSYVADAAGYRVTSNNLPVAPTSIKDTPEVANAKALHFYEIEKAKGRFRRDVLLTPGSTTHFGTPIVRAIPHALPTTHGIPVVTKDGFLADTPEVAAAKANHFAEHAAARARTLSPYIPIHHHHHLPVPIAHTLPAIPLVTRDGFIADTPEVAAAKAKHFAEVAAAKARNGYPFLF